jgi:epoxyqueuosine reductase QueG
MAALHPRTGLSLICDLCGGDPACFKRCATGAIVYEYADAGARAKRERLAARAGGEAPEE